MKTQYRGITPERLMEQVENTARWALDGPADTPACSFREVLRRGRTVPHDPSDPHGRQSYMELLLAAHFSTVASFVPTNVDTHIRHHGWQRVASREELRATVALIEKAAAWDVREVSTRTVMVPGGRVISGMLGEWLSVRAGALLRAMMLRADDVVDALTAAIDEDLRMEAEAFAWATSAAGDPITALKAAASIAHNLGDLSRVVEEWSIKTPQAEALAARYTRLGHEGESRYDGLFVRVGQLNKAIMANENNRFLPLREARALRNDRALLLPTGPFFDGWGAVVARQPGLSSADRASIVAALLEIHLEGPTQQGCLRALTGFHGAYGGGLDAVSRELPARLRKLVGGGPVRDALRVSAEHFEARVVKRYRALMG